MRTVLQIRTFRVLFFGCGVGGHGLRNYGHPGFIRGYVVRDHNEILRGRASGIAGLGLTFSAFK